MWYVLFQNVDAKLLLKNLRVSYPTNIIIGHLNINPLRNKFEIFSSLIADTFDTFKLSETKLDDTFTLAQFSINGFFVLHRLDRKKLIVLPLEKYAYPSNIEATFFGAKNLGRKKCLLCCSCNPHKNIIEEHLK